MVSSASEQKFKIYGGDHSPWVQALMLGLHERGIAFTLTPLPTLGVLRRSGMMMPAASKNGGAWQLESADMLVEVGFDRIEAVDLKAVYGAWRGVHHRIDNPLRFFHAWSLAGYQHNTGLANLRDHFLRSFVPFYMLTLITLMRWRTRPQPPPEPAAQFLFWEQRLADAGDGFLGGASPNMADLMLFGIVQCHASIPVPPLETLRQDPALPELRAWIGRMQAHYRGYPHLYSGKYFTPGTPQPTAAGPLARLSFWLGSITMLAAAPLSVPLALLLINRVQR